MEQVFSSIYSILPESKDYFVKGGYSKEKAGYASIGIFLLGVLGLQILTDILHRLLPSSIVECESHSHSLDHSEADHTEHDSHANHNLHGNGQMHEHGHGHSHHHHHESDDEAIAPHETSPLITRAAVRPPLTDARRISLTAKLSDSVQALVKQRCKGRCFGYTDARPCNLQCQSHVLPEEDKQLSEEDVESQFIVPVYESLSTTRVPSRAISRASSHRPHAPAGHHHVAKNEYLSIGLQTSIAVALHKMPEGFITYATNHASPELGAAVFIALAIHNVSEGFVMALPLFLALKSRPKAIITASLLGGLSQPLGALCAMLWLKSGPPPSPTVYGVFFALTAGIMSSVGLQLYGQACNNHHNSRLCLTFGFVGMGILGFSFAMMGGKH